MQNQTGNLSTTVPAQPSTSELCQEYTYAIFYGAGMPLYAIVAILIISLFERRRYKSDVCYGKPGLPLPINFLDGTSNSVANAAAFGCTLQHLIVYLFYTELSVDRWLIGSVLFLLTFLAALVFYPIFACLNSSSRVMGSLIGFIYTILLTSVLFARSYICAALGWYWALYAVTLVSEIYILILFVYRFFTAIFKKSRFHKDHLVKIDQVLHVKTLLVAPKSNIEKSDIRQRLVSYSENVLAEAKLCCLHKSLYRCTTRTLAINTIVLLLFYYNFLVMIYLGEKIESSLSRLEAAFVSSRSINVSKHIAIFTDVIRASWMIGNILSAVYLITNMVLIYRSQRQHLMRRWRGDKSFIPSQCKLDHSEMLVKNLMYAGHQVSYLFGGYLLFQTVVIAFCLLLSYFCILPIMKKVPPEFLIPLEFVLPSVIFLFVLRFILRFTSSRVFLQNHYLSSDNGNHWEKALALDNRRVYQNLSFFLFFYYILTGFYRCTFRVLTSICINTFHIARMDKSLLIPGFERFDFGYMTYLGFLEVELHQCHPVVVVCCDLLMKSVNHLSSKPETSLESPMDAYKRNIMSKMYTRKVRNKWQKMKTLILNQNLCNESKSNVSVQQPRQAKLTL
ncbi:stimulated by retinoic acid gene 6 protein-like [Crassostrea angulata]|uniref:stimulated by retinoic acid gene 6 protein-like n=1 Tax=Magallana angulata TaxID=2784310 RepID=UPI0022B14DDE|nr:stimulated by retinoic acid gene 6 protein-like [Crassostrea angulata]